MATATEITSVTYRWDAPCGVEPGWYCESYDGESRVDDSQKIWFPVAVDDFGHDQAEELEEALREAFPNAEIIFSE